MAKKTNKTEHVLNLLMGQNEKNQEAVQKGSAPQGAVQSQVIASQTVANQTILNQTIRKQTVTETTEPELETTPAKALPPKPQTAQACAHELEAKAAGADAPLVEAKAAKADALLPEAEGSLPNTENPLLEDSLSEAEATPLEAKASRQDPEASRQDPGASQTAAMPRPESIPTAFRPASPPSGIKFVESSKNENNPVSSAIRESLEREALKMGLISPPKEDGDDSCVTYRYINVMEECVKDRCEEYMVKLGICTCDRCRNDVMALALSNLPPKYIVTEKTAAAPLLNFFRSKFSSYIMAELTKACFAINSRPRHEPEGIRKNA